MNRGLFPSAIVLCLIAVGLGILGWSEMPTWILADNYHLRMRISGSGSPAVILESFGPAYLETWNQIQPKLANLTRVVSYDHGGYWGSEPGRKPRDAEHIAHDLHAALQNAKVGPPYLLVGYSFGGPYIRVFANLYPREVIGMVFIDPAQEEFSSLLNQHFKDINVVTETDLAKQDEWGSQRTSLRQAQGAILPRVPITLISAAQPGGPLLRRLLPEWLGAHQRWLAQFPEARHVVTTNSGHGIFFTEPGLVVREVSQMLERLRKTHE